MQSRDGQVRVALTTSTGGDTSPERFRAAAQGSGVQHYYADLQTRCRLDDLTIGFFRENNILYDETDEGSFLHLYTREIHGVFFEFVEQNAYLGFGAANAPVRLAAQAHDVKSAGQPACR